MSNFPIARGFAIAKLLLRYCHWKWFSSFLGYLSLSLSSFFFFIPWPVTHIPVLKHCISGLCRLLERPRRLHLFIKCRAFITHCLVRETFPAIKNQFQPNQIHLGVSQRKACQHGKGLKSTESPGWGVTGQKLGYGDLWVCGSQAKNLAGEKLQKTRKTAVMPRWAIRLHCGRTWQESGEDRKLQNWGARKWRQVYSPDFCDFLFNAEVTLPGGSRGGGSSPHSPGKKDLVSILSLTLNEHLLCATLCSEKWTYVNS